MALVQRIEKFWYSDSFFKWLLWPISILLFTLTKLKFWLYQFNLKKSEHAPKPVIIVGNLTAGGTGKTPFIFWLAKKLELSGYKVGIVSRGYGAKVKSYPHHVNLTDSVESVGDEVYMLKHQLDLPIVISPKRSQAAAELAMKNEIDVILSDDGLQHYQMARQFEFVVVDGSRGFGNKLCLPFGPMREMPSRLKTVDHIIQNGQSSLIDDLICHKEKTSLVRVKVNKLIHLKTGEPVSLSNLTSKSIAAVCGIGNPDRFFHTLSKFSNKIEKYIFADHWQYSPQDFQLIDSDMVIMTEKDAVKCKKFAKENWYYLTISLDIENSEELKIINKLRQVLGENYG